MATLLYLLFAHKLYSNGRRTFQDSDRFLSELPYVFDNFTVSLPTWDHYDFVYGIDADTLVYPRVLKNIADAEELYQRDQKRQDDT
jgi:hypothetical protein